MKNRFVYILIWVNGFFATSIFGSPAIACEQLKLLSIADTAITSATIETATSLSLTADGSAPSSFGLPSFCRVVGSIRPTVDSEIGFEVWLPSSGWNGRFLQLGNGGLAGVITTSSMRRPLQGGFTVAATDDGHKGSPLDGSWAIGHPEKVIDFGYRAVHLTSVAAKQLLKAYYRREATHSYFQRCSEGGREALMEAQRYPDDFDGIIVGAPGNYWTHLLAAFIWNSQALLNDPTSYIPPGKLKGIQAAALAACGTQNQRSPISS